MSCTWVGLSTSSLQSGLPPRNFTPDSCTNAPVQVNAALTLDFDNATDFDSHHLAFKVSDGEFDAIFGRIQAEGIPYGSGPFAVDDMKTNTWRGGRGLYFRDPNGHVLELLTAG